MMPVVRTFVVVIACAQPAVLVMTGGWRVISLWRRVLIVWGVARRGHVHRYCG